jgi:hypothetical protein
MKTNEASRNHVARLAILLLLTIASPLCPAAAQNPAGGMPIPYQGEPGLKVDPNSSLKVEVDLVQTNELGLTEKGIRQLCARRLKEAGIPVVPDTSTAQTNTLYFNVNVTQDSVAVTMAFAKLMVSVIGSERFLRRATTWTFNVVGEHRNSADIVQAGMVNAFDRFVTEYIRVNGSQTQGAE